MNSTVTAFIIIIMVLFLYRFLGNHVEGFELPGGELPLGSRIHVRLNSDGNSRYESFKPPSAHGELGCTQVPCPNKYADNKTCWCCCNYH